MLKHYENNFSDNERRKLYKNNTLQLLDFLVAMNSKPSNANDCSNTMNLALNLGLKDGTEIIQKILQTNPEPCDCGNYFTSIAIARMTGIQELIDIFEKKYNFTN